MSETFNEQAGMEALFDLSFRRFVTIGVIKIVYILGIVLLGIAWLFIVIAGFSQGFAPGLAAIFIATIGIFLELLFLRVGLELVVAIFRIAQNTSLLVGDRMATGGFPVMAAAAPATPPPSTIE